MLICCASVVKVCHVDIAREQCRVYQKVVLDKVSEQVSILNYEETPLQKEGEKKVIFTSLVTWSPLRKKTSVVMVTFAEKKQSWE